MQFHLAPLVNIDYSLFQIYYFDCHYADSAEKMVRNDNNVLP